MYKKTILSILCLLIAFCVTACSNPFYKEPEKVKQKKKNYVIKVLDKDHLKDDTYYVKHGEEFYEIPELECSFNDVNDMDFVMKKQETPEGVPERTAFFGKDKSELLIPTMYEDDELVYKSKVEVEDDFAWERFMDGGYTIGLCGMKMNNLSKISFSNWYTHIKDDEKEEEIFGREENEEKIVYYNLNAMDDRVLSADDVSEAGYLLGVEPNTPHEFDFYQGTDLMRLTLSADVRIFWNFENYWSRGMHYSDEGYVVIHLPTAFRNGYYKVNTSGIFRYIAQPYDANLDIATLKYNHAYFKKDEEGKLIFRKDEWGNYIYEDEKAPEEED